VARQRARTAAAMHAESAFSWVRAADEHEALYRCLIEEGFPRHAQGSRT
jgi:hypothetical protein